MNMILKDPSANPFEGLTEKVDFTALVPYQLATVLEQTPAQLSKVRSVIVGGAPLLKDVIHQLQELPSVCYATYGMTETITHVALQRLNGPGRQDYFQLLPGIHATTDARGCLVITATHLGPDPVVTNDVVSLLDEDKFRWIGRYDRVINSGGVKIHAEKIERVVEDFFSEWPVQRRFFVTGLPDQKFGEQVTLVVEGVELSQAAESRLKIRMKETLGSYELPKAIHYVPAFAETATQKVDRIETMRSVKK
jgi:O-succinylbenzoic acid--CoA ligase